MRAQRGARAVESLGRLVQRETVSRLFPGSGEGKSALTCVFFFVIFFGRKLVHSGSCVKIRTKISRFLTA